MSPMWQKLSHTNKILSWLNIEEEKSEGSFLSPMWQKLSNTNKILSWLNIEEEKKWEKFFVPNVTITKFWADSI